VELQLHLLTGRLHVDALELERVCALRLNPEIERRHRHQRHGADDRRSYLESDHA
jgi:hypothetical protein